MAYTYKCDAPVTEVKCSDGSIYLIGVGDFNVITNNKCKIHIRNGIKVDDYTIESSRKLTIGATGVADWMPRDTNECDTTDSYWTEYP